MRLGIAVPERHISKPVLDAALEATTRLDESMIKNGAPTFDEAGHRVQWRPEPPGQEHFDHVGRILPRGWADCDDLAPWHAASLRVTGEDPDAQAEVYRSGPKRWHAVVRRGDGSIDDPSEWRGMYEYKKRHGVSGIAGSAVYEPMVCGDAVVGAFDINPVLAAQPLPDGSWEARADLPWNYIPWNRGEPGTNELDVQMAALHRAPVASQAIVGAALGASQLARELECSADPEWCEDYFEALAMAHDGADWDDIADVYGDDVADAVEEAVVNLWANMAVVGGFRPFRGIARGVKKLARPIAQFGKTKGGRAAFTMVPGINTVVLARGASEAAKAGKRGAGFGGVVKAAARGGLKGGLDWSKSSPFLKYGAGMMGQKKNLQKLTKFAERSAKALEDTPKMAAKRGVPKFKKGSVKLDKSLSAALKRVKKKKKGPLVQVARGGLARRGDTRIVSPGQGIREVIIRA